MTSSPQGPGCICPLEGPDTFGNYDLIERPACPIHGTVEENTMDPYDAVQDHRAELAHDGEQLTTAQVVRLTLGYEETHDYYRKLSPLGRHPFGLPRLTPVGSTSPADVMTPDAGAAAPLSSAAPAPGSTSLPFAA